MSNFERVKKFMKTFGQEIKEKAEFPDNKITNLRYDLIKEELSELKEAIDQKDIKEVFLEYLLVLIAIQSQPENMYLMKLNQKSYKRFF